MRHSEPTAIEAAGACRSEAEVVAEGSQAGGGRRPAPEADQRKLVVQEARSWLGTPYHHEGDVKGAGVDCAMLIVRVFVDLGLVPAFDPRPYPQHWYLHRGEERYLGFIFDRAREVTEPGPGDVVMWRVGRTFSHGGIVVKWPIVVHAYARARRVIESDVSLPGIFTSEKHPRRFFSYWAPQAPAVASAPLATAPQAPRGLNGRRAAPAILHQSSSSTAIEAAGAGRSVAEVLAEGSQGRGGGRPAPEALTK